MDEYPRVEQFRYPWWVTLGMLGLHNRASVVIFIWISFVLAAGSTLMGLWHPRFYYVCLLLIAALMYWLQMRWIDRHGTWDDFR